MSEPRDLDNFDPTPPPVEAKWGSNHTLGDKFEIVLKRFIQGIVTWGSVWASKFLVYVFDQSMKILRPGMERATGPMIDNFINMPGAPDWFKAAMQSAKNEKGESAWIIKAMIFYSGVMATVSGGLTPYRKIAEYEADMKVRSYIPDPGTLATMQRLGLIDFARAKDAMSRLGVADELVPKFIEMSRNVPNLGDIIQASWRGIISEEKFDYYLMRMGYDPSDRPMYKELSKMIPPFTDIIRFMVREAFDDATSSKFGYDDDYPSEATEWAQKQGFAPEWAKRYWRAHWNLPSPTQGYEMLHRGLITEGELAALLKTADYPSYWRDKLVKMSYSTFTRVDIRRMVQTGAMTLDEAVAAYKENGYDDKKAKMLADFAAAGKSEKEMDLSRADIVGAYIDGITDRGSAEQALVKMGYDNEEAETILKRADFDIAKAERSDRIGYTKERYLAGLIDKATATAELTQAGLKTSGIDRYLLAWDKSKEAAVSIPTVADLKRFYKKQIISNEELRTALQAHGYQGNYLEWFMMEADLDAQANEEG